ncbi:E3 ubiquitin-protein ligase LIN-1 [Pyrus ussuriensis x Pyrus communis]|uniref:RING-type E3 ubiquitin transferase n=1 Tax=Pyrus ussuriensis x Pyrus communis TaxID=2448454 RepID=A0A5N5G104_9ROSA|nr:E3 ubiquitin-protein ligase LIN-1 [Pyrus ussuriensis x Pyrus communis]
MASSLQDLLAEDGFRGKKLLSKSKASSFHSGSTSRHLANSDPHKRRSMSGDRIRTEKTRSDVSRFAVNNDLPTGDGVAGRRPSVDGGSKKEVRDGLGETGATRLREARSLNRIFPRSLPRNEIVEVEGEDFERYKDIYSNELYSSEKRKDKYLIGSMEDDGLEERSKKDTEFDRRNGHSSNKYVPGRTSFSDSNRQSRKLPETSHDRSRRDSSYGKTSEDVRGQRHDKVLRGVPEPALDEIAIQAIVSILSGCIKQFLKDENFRHELRDKCISFLNFVDPEEGNAESRIIARFEQAIETVEKAAEESASEWDLKRASLQFSVITGLNNADLTDGLTAGVPNYKLSACAHLYLSVVYKLLKKDRVSAKHLLQVFCDTPFHARMTLLPELWDRLFLPHLTHLKTWYDQEADSIADTQNKPRKLKLLGKMYNEMLDSGTYQFAVYYKDWLTEGVESPPTPAIHIPSVTSLQEAQQGSSESHSSEAPSPGGPQLMVSKKLYDSVFSRASKPDPNDTEDDGEMENLDTCTRISDGSFVVKQITQDSAETVQYQYHDTEDDYSKSAPGDGSLSENGLFATEEQKWGYHGVSDLSESNLNHQFGDMSGENSEGPRMLDAQENKLTLKIHVNSVFEQKPMEDSSDHNLSTISNFSEPSIASSIPIKARSSFDDLHGNYFEEGVTFSGIPQDFICPLNGRLFEDPVTLETGQTFERLAIKTWLDQGNRTCPVTGKALECLVLPLPNSILKRVIRSWKSEHCRKLLAFASHVVGTLVRDVSSHCDETAISVLEQLLTCFSNEERTENAKHLISLGGLQFLLQRFHYGKVEEKSRAAALLLCCIEADADCRNQIARDINKQYVMEMLQSQQFKIRTNAVLLLTELICLKRKKDVTTFLSGLQIEGMVDTMDVLLACLQSSPANHRPLVAVLLLHVDLLVERKLSMPLHREEAVDAITEALDCSLTDENVQKNCCTALLILGRFFSCSRKSSQSWILKQEDCSGNSEVNSLDNEEDISLADDMSPLDEGENSSEDWLRNLTVSLLGYGKKSFVETLSKCLGSENLELIRMCLITVEWLSRALSSLSGSEFQLSAFSSLIFPLKQCLKTSEQVEQKILASMSMLNFSKISECRVLLRENTEDIAVPLENLAEAFTFSWSKSAAFLKSLICPGIFRLL